MLDEITALGLDIDQGMVVKMDGGIYYGAATVTPIEGIFFVRDHGVVLESARGPVPSLAEEITGRPIKGSSWAHPKSQEIFKLTRAVRDFVNDAE